jgi:hypothetical protein
VSCSKPQARVQAVLDCTSAVQRLTRVDGALAAVTCVHCSKSSAHANCVGCPCGDWHCELCVHTALAPHQATCLRAHEPPKTSA